MVRPVLPETERAAHEAEKIHRINCALGIKSLAVWEGKSCTQVLRLLRERSGITLEEAGKIVYGDSADQRVKQRLDAAMKNPSADTAGRIAIALKPYLDEQVRQGVLLEDYRPNPDYDPLGEEAIARKNKAFVNALLTDIAGRNKKLQHQLMQVLGEMPPWEVIAALSDAAGVTKGEILDKCGRRAVLTLGQRHVPAVASALKKPLTAALRAGFLKEDFTVDIAAIQHRLAHQLLSAAGIPDQDYAEYGNTVGSALTKLFEQVMAANPDSSKIKLARGTICRPDEFDSNAWMAFERLLQMQDHKERPSTANECETSARKCVISRHGADLSPLFTGQLSTLGHKISAVLKGSARTAPPGSIVKQHWQNLAEKRLPADRQLRTNKRVEQWTDPALYKDTFGRFGDRVRIVTRGDDSGRGR